MATGIEDEIARFRRQCLSRANAAATPEEAALWLERAEDRDKDGRIRVRSEQEFKDGAFMYEFGRLIQKATREQLVIFE
jgi:hypothetical protein